MHIAMIPYYTLITLLLSKKFNSNVLNDFYNLINNIFINLHCNS